MPEQQILQNLLAAEAVDKLLLSLTVIATATMAMTGVIQAIRNDFDIFGAGILGLITAVGGGTVRDLLLGATPVFWVQDQTYILIVILVAYVGSVYAKKMRAGDGRRERILNYIDSIGLGLFTILGVQKALSFDVEPAIAIFLGCITGIAGGMIRDMFTGTTPVVLKPSELYATISLLGGTIFVNMRPTYSLEVSSLVAFVIIVCARVWVIRRNVRSSSL